MRPWTTRTLNAVVVAAGFAAAGTGAAAADSPEATTPDLNKPDLSQVPDEIDFTVPLDTCKNPGVPGREKMPCADTTLRTNTPNLVKEVGAEIARFGHGVGNEVRDDEPTLQSGEATRLLGQAATTTAKAEQLTKTRPEVGVNVRPDHTGVLRQNSGEAELLDAEVGPRGETHEGASALDTAVDATVAQGYDSKPVTNPVGTMGKVVSNNPLQTSSKPVELPEVEHVVPATKDAPTVRRVADDPSGAVRDAATGLVTNPSETLSMGEGSSLNEAETLPVGDVLSRATALK
ncbi:hypothetical protein CDG81_04870 [Actinopolyspora erythraea]|uniref:Uncharacterized protein n=1 Tax=Actinopolyspora erythraea TaxID=414996 RepID=A0A099D3Q9_9ACTN|nr:hypothetical protein [Actinopolyspora erythraea]ASU77758.1 hypothetical protein CDG81_04870 [Actinopolyspora erythraea]KGI79965.1 hypothetical protein IL38_19855 [Actinopolyspora erythraea]